jgi:hypothetical protein
LLKCGIEGSCVESFVNLVAKNVFASIFFINLVSGNSFYFVQFLVEISGVKARTSAIHFPMWQNPLRSFCHIGSADYIRRCCSSLRELRTSVNLQNPKNGSKLPSRDFANPPNR